MHNQCLVTWERHGLVDNTTAPAFLTSNLRHQTTYTKQNMTLRVELAVNNNQKSAIHWHLSSLFETERLVVIGQGIVWNWFSSQLTLPAQFLAKFEADFFAQGVSFLERLEGQFCLIVFDKVAQTLHAFRDISCYYPLYFTKTSRGVAVSFHMKPLLALRSQNELSSVGLMAFLRTGYAVAPTTIIKGINNLVPGGRLYCDADGNLSTPRNWQTPVIEPNNDDMATRLDKTRRTFLKVLGRGLDGVDAPIGLFLSGGIDSAAIAAVLSTHYDLYFHAYTFGLDIPHPKARYLDDLPYAQLVAESHNIPHSVYRLDTAFPIISGLKKIIPYTDSPQVSPNIITKGYVIEQAGQQGITMMLTGSGATVPYEAVPEALFQRRKISLTQSAPAISSQFLGRFLTFEEIHALFPSLRSLGINDFTTCAAPYFEGVNASHPMDVVLAGTSLLLRSNKMSPVHQIAGRPHDVSFNLFYLDFAFNQYGAEIPRSMKHGSEQYARKHLLKEAFADIVPEAIRTRKKAGYPSYYWYRGELGKLQQFLFSDDVLSQLPFIDPQALRALCNNEKQSKRKSIGKKGWGLTVFIMWYLHMILGYEPQSIQ